MLQGMSTQPTSTVKLISPLEPLPAQDGVTPNITFKWEVDPTSVGGLPVKSQLFVSVYTEGQGLFPDDFVMAVEVAQVIRRNGALHRQYPRRNLNFSGQLVAAVGEEVRKAVDALDEGGSLPGQVVEPHMI